MSVFIERVNEKSEVQLACELIKILDGVSIYDATQALLRAQSLLLQTQVVSAESPLFVAADETAKVLRTA